MIDYVERVIKEVYEKNPNDNLFTQTVSEVLTNLKCVMDLHPEYEKYKVLERLTEPERQIIFRVTWVDDNGEIKINKGYRIQFNSCLGPYKGGLRFHPSVTVDTMKFLGFEQTFKNSLTGFCIGGAKGGSDFDPRGKSDGEIMRFCQSFMTELYRHIGPDTDVPAGDIGVSSKEIGYLFGQYKKIKNSFENGVITGKQYCYGGSKIRPEATGFGAVYYTEQMLSHYGETIKDKKIAVSGFGNVAWGVCKKATEEGAKVITVSGPDGYVKIKDGLNENHIDCLLEMRKSGRDKVRDLYDKYPDETEFYKGLKPWNEKVDIIMPCAIQNEIGTEDAENIIKNGIKYYVEVSNMPTTQDAMKILEKKCIVCPSKAVNAGGVAVSALEMSQNSQRLFWTSEEVDNKLREIMKEIFNISIKSANKYGLGDNLVAGANIAGFERVAEALISQGIL